MKNVIYTNRLISLLSLLLVLGQGCVNKSDSIEELSGRYFYRNEGVNAKEILSHQKNKKEVYGKVISYDYNSDFIIVLQEPNYEDYKNMIAFNLRDDLKKYPVNSQAEQIQSEKIADSILNNHLYFKKIFYSKINYWVIVNKLDTVIGPLTKEEYIQQRKELNVPDELEL